MAHLVAVWVVSRQATPAASARQRTLAVTALVRLHSTVGAVAAARLVKTATAKLARRLQATVRAPVALAERRTTGPVALAAARAIEWGSSLILPHQEPLLHRLLVNIFGRTCGHSAAKLYAATPALSAGSIGFEDTLAQSVHWFLDQPRA